MCIISGISIIVFSLGLLITRTSQGVTYRGHVISQAEIDHIPTHDISEDISSSTTSQTDEELVSGGNNNTHLPDNQSANQ